MNKKMPRVLIGGTGSDCGKTTVVCSLLKALKDTGKNPAAFKCGPDYIDPMFHSEIIGTKSRNLDMYLCGEDMVKTILGENSSDDGIAVIEGVMGIYDGFGFDNDEFSANHIAKVTGTPEILVVNVRGKSSSLLAEISGYLNYFDNNIKGVILNRCTKGMYSVYKKSVEENLGIKCYGFLPKVEGAGIENRHLGLVTAGEISDLKTKVNLLGKAALECLDLDGIVELSESALEIEFEPVKVKETVDEKVKIGVAKDKAFNFYYEDNFELLKKAGAEIEFFSPIEDEKIPEGVSGLIFGGGYPEVYAKELSENTAMLESVKNAAEKGMPIFAECGGFMYLGKSIDNGKETIRMTGVLESESHMTDSLVRFGYKTLEAKEDTVIASKGESIRCHEFHYSDSSDNGCAFSAVNRRGKAFDCFVKYRNVLAGYPHIHFAGNPDFAVNFVCSCDKYRKGETGF